MSAPQETLTLGVACPVGRPLRGVQWAEDECPTRVQRAASGTLIEGIALHLRMVHKVEPQLAADIAGRYVNDE